MFILSEMLQGMAQSPKFSLSMTYMDDNAKDKSPFFFGKETRPLFEDILTFKTLSFPHMFCYSIS